MLFRHFKRNLSKLVAAVLVFTAVFTLNLNNAYAAVDCNASGSLIGDEPPSLEMLVCPIVRVFNMIILLVGVVLIIMIIYGAIKLALSLGDPKGLESAKATWVHAGIGLGIVLGFWGILTILMNRFGITNATRGFTSPMDPFNKAGDGITNLLEAIGITP